MTTRLSTGIPGLDGILDGGLFAGESYLIRGASGTGKTTAGLQFLRAGEGALRIGLTDPESTLKRTAERRGWDLAGI